MEGDVLSEKEAFVEHDRVDFGTDGLKAVNVRANSAAGGTVEIHLDKADGPLVAKIEVAKGADWSTVNAAEQRTQGAAQSGGDDAGKEQCGHRLGEF